MKKSILNFFLTKNLILDLNFSMPTNIKNSQKLKTNRWERSYITPNDIGYIVDNQNYVNAVRHMVRSQIKVLAVWQSLKETIKPISQN